MTWSWWAPSQTLAPIISDATRSTNGLSLKWEDQNTNTAYRVQVRDSLSSTNWHDASMRYRWPWPYRQRTDAASTLQGPRFYTVEVETVAPANRGKLFTNSVVRQLSTNQVRSLMVNFTAFDYKWVTPGLPVKVLRFSCETIVNT